MPDATDERVLTMSMSTQESLQAVARGDRPVLETLTQMTVDTFERSGLDAQTYALDFYARFGFVAEGDRYLEDGIEHQTMRRAALVSQAGARAMP